jgi:hypothetical protein
VIVVATKEVDRDYAGTGVKSKTWKRKELCG